jgi:hypothetical protein
MRDAIAEALYPISAYQLADFCDDLDMPPAGPDDHPMSSKRAYVRVRLKTLDTDALLAMAHKVHDETHDEPLAAVLAEAEGRASGVAGELKNIIFATVGPKPRIVLRDAINNDIELVDGADRCLVYDEPLLEDGLTWRTLVQWWARKCSLLIKDDAHERGVALELFGRLNDSLANEAERVILRTYSALYGKLGFDIPALLPQVFLHYDPYSAHDLGGRPYLARQRMDFLLLLPRRARVVVELDGKHHYGDEHGYASPERYAAMVKEDRALRLAGYEVFRFGGHEVVNHQNAATMLNEFFRSLLARHRVLTTTATPG